MSKLCTSSGLEARMMDAFLLSMGLVGVVGVVVVVVFIVVFVRGVEALNCS